MNYYIQGDHSRTEEIREAFEKLGYDTSGHLFNAESVLYFTLNGDIRATTCNCTPAIIKTHPDYKELELPVEPKFKNGDTIKLYGENCIIVGVDVTNQLYNIHSDNPIIGYELLFKDQDKAELVEPQPKFKVGDWLVYENSNCFAGGLTEAQVAKVKDGVYFFASGTSGSFKFIDECCRLWTIADAKNGDVLTNGKLIVIFNKLEEPDYKQHIIAYVGLDLCGRLQITEDTWQLGIDKAMPATKEQRDLLFAKIKEAGYEWDAEKKELRKIKPHYNISNFHAGMPVLVRADNDCCWDYSIFSRNTGNEYWHFALCNGVSFTQCIPFDGNEHLLGTTDMCDEMYINW